MGSYVFTKARKTAFRKAQEKAWAMRRGTTSKGTVSKLEKLMGRKMTPIERAKATKSDAAKMKRMKQMIQAEKDLAAGKKVSFEWKGKLSDDPFNF
jgi:uncharacterized protein YggE